MSRKVGLGCVLALALAGCTNSTGGSSSPQGLDGAPGGGGGGDPAANTQTARFFLPTDEPTNTSAPAIEVDARGGIHAVYPAYARGSAYYAYCPGSCTGPEQMKVVPFETEGTVHNAMLALDAEGRPQVLLSTGQRIYYAKPAGDFTDPAAWTTSVILDHQGDREVTGEAFALDPAGRPRFVMHVYEAYLGVGQKPPATFFVACDDACNEPTSWTTSTINSKHMLRGGNLRFDANGAAHLVAAMPFGATESSSGTQMATYLRCDADCDKEESWNGIGLAPIYENPLAAVAIKPSMSLALTKSGAPRVVVLASNEGAKNVLYFQCDDDCVNDHWSAAVISNNSELGDGVDLALDANDRPRFAYTIGYNIGLYSCDAADCTATEAQWDLAKVELGSEMKPDEIILWDNCTVAQWFLHSPSLALDAAGHPRVGYQARDISGGYSNPDPTKPRCVAGTDMTWSRLAILPSVK